MHRRPQLRPVESTELRPFGGNDDGRGPLCGLRRVWRNRQQRVSPSRRLHRLRIKPDYRRTGRAELAGQGERGRLPDVVRAGLERESQQRDADRVHRLAD